MWQRAGYVDALADRHRVIQIDHRGQGLSDRPAGLEAHRMGQYTADVQAVLGRPLGPFDRSIDMHVSHLRRKLEGERPVIKTIRGVGYQFVQTPEDAMAG